jgi:hypothetical protein
MSVQTKEKVITEGAEIYCERRGSGPLLLLITGGMGDADFYSSAASSGVLVTPADSLITNNNPVHPILDIYEAMVKEEPQNQYLWPKILQLARCFTIMESH